MTSVDVQRTAGRALKATGLTDNQGPKLLSNNDSCYISEELKDFICDSNLKPIRRRPNHP